MPTENEQMIENLVVTTIRPNQLPTEEDILKLVQGFRLMFPISEEEASTVLRKLHTRLSINMDTGTAIVEDHQPWLFARKPEIDPYYWNRYEKYLIQSVWSPRVVNALDRVTDEILDLMGNPIKTESWLRRGLVVGDVQSGKTANYTALCCKAADAGYRLIILLTGTLENLRRQTQERLDAGFVGLDSSGLLSQQRTTREVGVGILNRIRMAGVFTSTKYDFKSELMNQLGFKLSAFAEPVLVVVKKNKRILENLENWLRSYNVGSSGRIDTPMLLIDDEADNASINTSPNSDDPTAINERIRALLHLFTRSTYIGFTATPFANIFIDPDSENDMVGDDLFPKHFIYALEAPTNYIGTQSIFGEETHLDCLREIDDSDIIFPLRHRITLIVESLPGSLMEAVRSFIVSNAIRDLRGEDGTHRSMLVNVSRFTGIQEQVARLLDYELREINREIRNYSQLDIKEACRSEVIAAIRNTWEKEFSDAGFAWLDVQHSLLQAALPIEVRSVNQRSGAKSLDYSTYREKGLRVVAVGGNSLSRGLTLEGLSISYFLRNSQMYDTLLQMGRWFGYRDGYADLCRIWLPVEAIHWYRYIALATEELRSEIYRMQSLSLTPKDFGLKVRAHPDSLIVTARNKMRSARTIERVISISGQRIETPRLYQSIDMIRANATAAESLFTKLRMDGILLDKSPYGNNIWRAVNKELICRFLRRFESHPLNLTFQKDDLAQFLENTDEAKLQMWDIVLPNGGETEEIFAGIVYHPQKRRIETRNDSKMILVSGTKARVGSRGIDREGIPQDVVVRIEEEYRQKNQSVPDKAFTPVRSRPLLLVHIVKPVQYDRDYNTGGNPLIALGLSFPEFNDSTDARKVRYRINLVEWRNMFQTELDDDVEMADDNI
ncbi:MAG: Z1 domain-containing protein [Proteobacteria bacterium]|nr:Z1 domain-containing protein [Pseudomonadota bacterium]